MVIWLMYNLLLYVHTGFRTLFIMASYLHGHDETARITRRTVARYMMFGFILILRSISSSVMKRFPTLEHIIEAGKDGQWVLEPRHEKTCLQG